jgi:DNA polymerase III epsilon subunit family exonuclease
MEIVIFDLETTGFSHVWSEIIQIAAIRMRDGKVCSDESFATFVRPQRSIPAFITKLTGITDDDVREAPCSVQALTSFSRFVGDAILLGHNARRFDMPFIRRSCVHHQLAVRQVRFIDSLDFSRELWGGGVAHGLDAIVDRLNIPERPVRHTAPGDVALLVDAVIGMWNRLTPDFQTCPVAFALDFLPE